MPILLLIFIPLGALVIYAVVFDLKQRRHRGGAPGSHDISSAARMARANADARGGSGLGAGGDAGGIGAAIGGGGGPVG
jgi:hypothetical protein